MRAATNASLPWDQILSALWLQIMTGIRALLGNRSHSGRTFGSHCPRLFSRACMGSGELCAPQSMRKSYFMQCHYWCFLGPFELASW